VSLHDVSPLTQRTSQAILAELGKLGVACCSLLVVADHHHRGHFLDDKTFCDWLAEKHDAGNEIVIHGYHHIRDRKASDSTWQKLMTRAYTADEGEFYDIDERSATDLLAKALDEFARFDFHPRGFIAPAWLLSEAGESAARKAGFQYTTRLRHVLALGTGVRHDSMSMVYSVRSGWRRTLSLAWNASLYRRLAPNPLLRVSIHPPDYDYKKIWRQIAKYIALAVKDRAPMTYGEWVSSQQGLVTADSAQHGQS